MITYNGLALFNSGPSHTEPGPTQSRDAVADVPGGIGASVIGQGQVHRTLAQRGELIADDVAALRALIDTIIQQVGAGSATLIDEHGTAWPGCVMQRFKPGPNFRVGPRYATHYTIDYLQATP